MPANEITSAIEPSIDDALKVIGEIAQKQAQGRAASIAQLSGGAVTTSPEQVEAIASGIRAAMVIEIRDQVRSTLTAYTASSLVFKG